MSTRRVAGHRKRSTTRLTPREVEVLEQVSLGSTNAEAGRALSIETGTVGSYLRAIGDKLHANSRATKVHAALVSDQLRRPDPLEAPCDITDEDRLVWRAVATRPSFEEIARFLAVPKAEAQRRVRDLKARTQARNEAHLIRLGHAYGVLGTTPTSELAPLSAGA